MQLVHPESQSVNRLIVLKAVGPSWLFIMMNILYGLRRFIDRSLSRRGRPTLRDSM